MSKKKYKFYLEDIEEAINKIVEYTKGYDKERFLSDKKTIDAVLRNLSIIGEAANHIPKEIQNKHPKIDWPAVIGLRNRIIHDYFGIDHDIIWYIIKEELFSLLVEIKGAIRG